MVIKRREEKGKEKKETDERDIRNILMYSEV
jgi:hypothetical protein